MVSEDERVAIDAMAASVSRTRSSVLVRIVNAFMKDVGSRGGAENVMQLLQEVRSGKLSRETLGKHR
jgi:hypothetical protein